jgi:uncharacterized protein YjiS (DUF1127 family)
MIALPRLSQASPIRADVPARRDRPGVVAMLEQWIERHRQRRALLELSDHMLKDIGISAGDAWQEGRKPFWRP